MCSSRVLMMLVALVGYVQSGPWDIVAGNGNQLKFYYNGTLMYTEDIPSADDITSVYYDPVVSRVVFVVVEDMTNGYMTIYSLDLTTMKIQPLVKKQAEDYFPRAVYDPVTQLLFWKENKKIYSISLNPASSGIAVDGNLIVTSHNNCHDIAVDSCEGYIYWITDYEIERARFDGSEREVLINSVINHRGSLTIDQQTRKIYWTETILTTQNKAVQLSIKSADFNGKNKTTLHIITDDYIASSLTVSKDFIYWGNHLHHTISQLPKDPAMHVEVKEFANLTDSSSFRQRIAANYTISEQTRNIKSCNALKRLQPCDTDSEFDSNLFCVNGTKVSGESRCECAQGYIGERCDVSICQNYCLQGGCSVSAEGLPKCSCKAGYSGERCEVDACHKHCFNNGICTLNEEAEPVCQCTADYDGERCEVSICKDYCYQGVCSVSAEGLPICRCKGDYSGARCEVNVCQEYCLNGGVCSLNEEDEPVCQCTKDYEGNRCDVPISLTKYIQTVSMLRDMLNADITPASPGTSVQLTCASTII